MAAKTDLAHAALTAQFQQRTVHRRYLALCHGGLTAADPNLRAKEGVEFAGDSMRVHTHMGRHPRERQKQAVLSPDHAHGKPAATNLQTLETFSRRARPIASLLSCRLETGRTHQIRVHLAYLNHGMGCCWSVRALSWLGAQGLSAIAHTVGAHYRQQQLGER